MNEYTLVRSAGSTERFSKHISPNMREKLSYVSEERFLSEVRSTLSHNTVCICDSPGMGKTWLLENLARKIYCNCSNIMVAFISVSEFTQQAIISRKDADIGYTFEIQALLAFLSPSRLMKTILSEALRAHHLLLELLLDGFDEVPKEYLDATKDFFKNVANSHTNVRLYITSRPHMRSELEQTFQAIPYEILPFSEENQVEYLVNFWKTSEDFDVELDEEKLKPFAVACLEGLRKSLTSKECDLMGIPLQCRLLATVNMINVHVYCSRNRNCTAAEFVSTTSMYDMYRKYFEMEIDRALKGNGHKTPEEHKNNPFIYKLKKLVLEKRRKSSLSAIDVERNILKAFHVWKALQLLYPHLAIKYFLTKNLSQHEPFTKILACGLLQTSSSSYKEGRAEATFLHRTFAEFLVAELFAEIFTGYHTFEDDDVLQGYLDTFFRRIVYLVHPYITPCEVTMKFLNSSLSRHSLDHVPLQVAKLGAAMLHSISPSSILSAAIRAGHGHIIRLINVILCQAYPGQTVPRKLFYCSRYDYVQDKIPDQHCRSCKEYWCMALECFNAIVLEELNNLYVGCFGKTLDAVLADMPTIWLTPLHYAVKLRHYSAVEYLASRVSLAQACQVLYHCVEYTENCTPDEVNNIIEICVLLLGKCEVLRHEPGLNAFGNALFAKGVHVEIIKFLVSQGFATRANGKDLTTWSFKWLKKEHFYELCLFLANDVSIRNPTKHRIDKWNEDLADLITSIDVASLTHILDNQGIDCSILDDDKNNLILYNVLSNGNLDIVELLIERGVDAHHKNTYGQGAAHLAARTGNATLMEYFLSKGTSLEDRDNDGNTPLHYAHSHLKMVKFLVAQNVNILPSTKTGNTIAHFAAQENFGWNGEVVGYLITFKTAYLLFHVRNVQGNTAMDNLYANKYFAEMVHVSTTSTIPPADKNERGLDLLTLALKTGQEMAILKELIEENDHFYFNIPLKLCALHRAAKKDNFEVMRYCVSLGFPLESRDDEGNTPLLVAAKSKNLEIATYLLSENADAAATDHHSNNIAHILADTAGFVERSFNEEKYACLFQQRNKRGRTPLHEWVTEGVPLNIIKSFTKISILDVHEVDATGRTIFLSAVAQGYKIQDLDYLYRFGFDHTVVDKKGQNALHIAAEKLYYFLPEYLESLGIFPNVLDNNGDTPLHIAAKTGLWWVNHFITPSTDLLARNSEKRCFVHVAKLSGRFKDINELAIKALLELPQGKVLFNMRDNQGQTPLHRWIDKTGNIWSCRAPVVEKILQKCGVDVNQRDENGNTMFLSAVNECCVWLAMCLQQNGANIEAINNRGDNALHVAVRNTLFHDDENIFDTMTFLVGIGCNKDHRNNKDLTPRQLATTLRGYHLPEAKFQRIASIL